VRAARSAVVADPGLLKGDVIDAVAELVEKSLAVVETTETEPRLRLLETTRAYALERLGESGEREAVDAWLAAASITEGPLFRRIWRLPLPRVAKGTRPKPSAARYRVGSDPIDTDSIALIVQKWTGLAGFDGAAFAGHSLRRGAISSGVAAGVHIARLKQFSGHASLKSLEEYVELDELRHNHPLKGCPLRGRRKSALLSCLSGKKGRAALPAVQARPKPRSHDRECCSKAR
jgi:hypothetical protein